MTIIYHLIHEADWEAATPTGELRPASLAAEGYIHCCKDEEQVVRVANSVYPGRQGIIALELDTGLLISPLKHEPSRSGEIFPRLYGPLNVEAVVRMRNMSFDADGQFYLTDR
jgi:uncharacterized protein (DUF952 family)